MKRFLLPLLLLPCLAVFGKTITVRTNTELLEAARQVQPGDVVILQDGEWKNLRLELDCQGQAGKPITFRAQTAGKALITGQSSLKLGGNYIVVDGFYFTRGYAGSDAVIEYRIDKKRLANNCRVTNCVIDDFNNPRRMQQNDWISFYGKNNRLDHCTFRDKKNMGVLLAVILDDERSRENFHSIDHNYFAHRPALASNGGEIIRVGVSQHCQFNSNTQITDNFFEYCDGETEIVSIKSGSNVVRNNLFKESQGGVVLRHGDNNTVENNVFLGNNKEGTGGVRIINKGQWVVNNLFYECRGVDFRSPLSIMNGVPNSPAFRYVQVTDAVVVNNSFYNCSSISFCEGSDKERSLAPDNVLFANNLFYNNRDSFIYRSFDDISGFRFAGNEVSTTVRQQVNSGFAKTQLATQKANGYSLPRPAGQTAKLPDSLKALAQNRLQQLPGQKSGFADAALLKKIGNNAYNDCGARWFAKINTASHTKMAAADCSNAKEVYAQLEKAEPVLIRLTGSDYTLNKPFVITKKVEFLGANATPVRLNTGNMLSVFTIAGEGDLSLINLSVDGSGVKATHFISSDTSGSSSHYNLSVKNLRLNGLDRANGCETIFYAHKSMLADSIVVRNSNFSNNKCSGFLLKDEKDDKGYYNAEKIIVDQNEFTGLRGPLLAVYRGGNDESTLGPKLQFTRNRLNECETIKGDALIQLTGVQQSNLSHNLVKACNPREILLTYRDIVRARHLFGDNTLSESGTVEKNGFVVGE